MELSRQRMREHTLKQFKHIRTCVLARELCLLVRTNRGVFNAKDASKCCSFISKLCKEAGCDEPSDYCGQAAEIALASEEKYLDLCQQSCIKCGESRRPTPKPRSERRVYVA